MSGPPRPKSLFGRISASSERSLADSLRTERTGGILLFIGAAIGLLSGMVGVGGGIFLTPILLLMRWSETKTAAAVSVLFILVNSFAGLLGNYLLGKGTHILDLPNGVWFWIAAAVAGGLVGSTLGAKKFDSLMLRRVLAVVLLFAGVKLIFV